MGWSLDELAARANVSKGMVVLIEHGQANVTVDLAGKVLSALDVTIDLRITSPHVEPRQRDAAHARCVAYAARRLVGHGWLVRREVEIKGRGSHGWIDILIFEPETRTLLVIEVKTEIHDVGQIERTLHWYGREARSVGVGLGWRPATVRTALLVLATDANDDRLRENRDALAQTFPVRAMALLERGDSGLALIDPRSRRRDWLIRARIDGRRSPARYRNYAHFLRGQSR
jgi:transcriptional regulator with XRE-family HTH domain